MKKPIRTLMLHREIIRSLRVVGNRALAGVVGGEVAAVHESNMDCVVALASAPAAADLPS